MGVRSDLGFIGRSETYWSVLGDLLRIQIAVGGWWRTLDFETPWRTDQSTKALRACGMTASPDERSPQNVSSWVQRHILWPNESKWGLPNATEMLK